jgi:hypothetical protein
MLFMMCTQEAIREKTRKYTLPQYRMERDEGREEQRQCEVKGTREEKKMN